MKVMFPTIQVAATLVIALLSAACAPPETPEVVLTDKVKAVVDRSKTTSATYAMYSWNEMTVKGQPVQEWAAEFHSGDKHRVETPRDRVIADCKAQTGVGLSLTTGEIFEGPFLAKTACGINTNKAFTDAEWQGVVQTPFGAADRVRLTDRTDIRTYDISPTGVILRATYADNSPSKPTTLSSEAVAVLSELPAPDMFDRASLARSYVPDRFKIAPEPAN